MANYSSWVVIQSRERLLEDILRKNARVDLSPRPPVSLSLVRDAVELRMPNPGDILSAVTPDHPLRAVSSAPIEDIRKFHGKRFQNFATRYEIQCDACDPDIPTWPYKQRFLNIAEVGPGVATKADDRTPITKAVPEITNLWLRPERVDFTEGDVSHLFGEGGAATQLENSFFLPPFRTDASNGGPETYFSDNLVRLRRGIEQIVWKQEPDPYRNPVALTLLQLADNDMLRDVLLDGGILKWTNAEGCPTDIQLMVADDGGPAAAWRARMISEPGHPSFQEWVRPLTTALKDDIHGLLPQRCLGIERLQSSERGSWTVAPRTFRI